MPLGIKQIDGLTQALAGKLAGSYPGGSDVFLAGDGQWRSPSEVSTMKTTSEHDLSGTGSVVLPVLRVTGCVRIFALGGTVKTALSNNHTAASFRLNDQTAQVPITLASGVTLSSLPVGSTILRSGLAAEVLAYMSAAAGALLEPVAVEEMVPTELVVQAKPGANTDIEYLFTTTNNPATGKIAFWAIWQALDGALTAV